MDEEEEMEGQDECEEWSACVENYEWEERIKVSSRKKTIKIKRKY